MSTPIVLFLPAGACTYVHRKGIRECTSFKMSVGKYLEGFIKYYLYTSQGNVREASCQHRHSIEYNMSHMHRKGMYTKQAVMTAYTFET